ncbi:hypothetical protein X777_16947 [Ooceraea biroi]|uniref:Uncharacterized protein n=1 Tax=Ooceraea biroi TaxID=2015173 RepID=A0A026WSH7_OOCBI|nr:hypothetical protein X777_16947 [Ooceraea biroi]
MRRATATALSLRGRGKSFLSNNNDYLTEGNLMHKVFIYAPNTTFERGGKIGLGAPGDFFRYLETDSKIVDF